MTAQTSPDAATTTAATTAAPMRPDQVDEVVALRAVLLASMQKHVEDPAWRGPARELLLELTGSGRAIVQVVEVDGRVVACAGALLQQRLPTPGTISGTYGWLEQVATVPDARGHGHARACVEACLQWLREQGVAEVQMQATEDGEPLYRELGFADDPQARLVLQLHGGRP